MSLNLFGFHTGARRGGEPGGTAREVELHWYLDGGAATSLPGFFVIFKFRVCACVWLTKLELILGSLGLRRFLIVFL